MEQIAIDLIPTGTKPICHASQYDIGRRIRFVLFSKGQVFTLSGTETITAILRKPDGTQRTENIANTSSTYVDLITSKLTCDQAGDYDCELKVVNGTSEIGSGNFLMKVEEDALNGAITEKTASGAIASFNTQLPFPLTEAKFTLPYKAGGYTSLEHYIASSNPTYDQTPYAIRQTPITANRTLEKLIGVSCAFNQLVSGLPTITECTLTGGIYTVNTTITSDIVESITNKFSITANHVYWLSEYFNIYDFNIFGVNGITNTIAKANASGIPEQERVLVLAGTTAGTTFSPMCVDLTACFGSEVADYFYNLEQNTAGSGIALFRQLFPEDYYAYQTATLISSKPTSKVIKDSNDQTIATYPLGGDELRGLLKVVDGQLVAYGDVKGSDGIIYRNFEERAYVSGDESLPNAITDGTNTVVELTTPTTASGTPFTNPMLCGSTEEFTDSRTIKMPCGHDSIYANDLGYGKATFGQTIYGGELDAVSGVLTSRYNANGSQKATPDIIQLTPQAIITLLGTNKLWNEAGNSEVKYIDKA